MQLFPWIKETWLINFLLVSCSISFLIFAFIHIYLTHFYKKKLPINTLNSSKTVLQSICVILVFIEVLERFYGSKIENHLHCLSALVLFVAELFSVFLVQYDRLHAQRRSFLQFYFKLSCTLVVSIYMHHVYHQKKTFYFIILFLYLLLNITLLFLTACCNEKVAKNNLPQSKACIASHFFFWWFSRLVLRVGRGSEVEREVWPLKHTLTSSHLTKLLQKACEDVACLKEFMHEPCAVHGGECFYESKKGSTEKTQYKSIVGDKCDNKTTDEDRGNKMGLVRVLVRCVWREYLKAASINIVSDTLMLASPLLLKIMIKFCRDASVPTSELMVVVVMLFVCSSTHTLLKNHCTFMYNIVSFRVHTILYNAIYRKLMRRGGGELSKVVNLMTVDVQKVVDVVSMLNYLWSFPLQTGICLHLLWQLLGPPCLTGLGVMVAMLPINSWVAAKCKVFQANQLKHKDARVKMVHEVVSAIKVIKLYAWEHVFLDRMHEARTSELRMLLKTAYLSAVATFAWASTPLLISASTFAVFTLTSSSPLTAEKAFVSLSLFNILRSPLSMLPILVTNLTVAKVSVKRLEEFFGIEEGEAGRGGRKHGEYMELDDDTGFDVIMREASVAWEGDPVLHNINIKVERGTLVGVVGGVSSGKSTLLSSLLGQTLLLRGSIKIKGTMAYSGQEAWLQNLSIRDNILFGSQMDADRYEQVLEACCLRRDLQVLPQSDLTEVAEKGGNLSGGQKQRICIARSIYKHSDIYLFDDPFAALDNHVSKQIFKKVFSCHSGFLRHKTRITVTNNLCHIEHFDHIIMLSNEGRVVFNGPYHSFCTYPSFIHLSSTHSSLIQAPSTHLNDGEILKEKKEDGEKSLLEQTQNIRIEKDGNIGKKTNHSTSQNRLEQEQPSAQKPTPSIPRNHSAHLKSSLKHPSCHTFNTLPRKASKLQQTSPSLCALLRYESLPDTFNFLMNPDLSASSYSLYQKHGLKKEEVISDDVEDEHDDDVKDKDDEIDKERRSLKDVVVDGGVGKKGRKLVEDEVLKTGKMSSKVYLGYVSSIGGVMVALALSSCVLNNVLLVATNIWLSRWADQTHHSQPSNSTSGLKSFQFSNGDAPSFIANQSHVITNQSNFTANQLNVMAMEGTGENDAVFRLIIYIVLAFLFSTTLLLRSLLVAMACARASKQIFTMVLRSVINSTFSFFQTTPTGRIVNRLSVDIATVDFTLPFTVSGFVNICLMATFSFCIIAYNLPFLLLPSIPLFLIHQVLQKYYRRTLRQLRRLEGIKRSLLITHIGETLKGLAVVKAWGQERRFEGMLQDKVDEVQSIKYFCLVAVRWLSVWLELVGNLLVMGVGVMAVFVRWQLSAGLLGLVMTYSFDIVQSVNSLLSLHCELESGMVAVERLLEYAALPSEVRREIGGHGPLPAGWPMEGGVAMKGFTGGYDSSDVLFGVDLSISAGEKLGVVGRTGSGKSSLLMTLLRGLNSREGVKKVVGGGGVGMVDGDGVSMVGERLVGDVSRDALVEKKCEKSTDTGARGVVMVDGVDISSIPLRTLRSRITIIPQDPVIFSGSLRFNIDPTHHHSDEQVWHVLRGVCMETTVLSLPGGLDHVMQPDELSVGQKQLMCLARAVLRRSRVLLLDEATASVDPATQHTILSLLNLSQQTETEIVGESDRRGKGNDVVDGAMQDGAEREGMGRRDKEEGMEMYLRGCTMVVVAHRLTNVLNCHRVVVMEEGRLVEEGDPQMLLANHQSIFYKMYNNILPNN